MSEQTESAAAERAADAPTADTTQVQASARHDGELRDETLESVAGGDVGGNIVDAIVDEYKDIKKGIMCTLREFGVV